MRTLLAALLTFGAMNARALNAPASPAAPPTGLALPALHQAAQGLEMDPLTFEQLTPEEKLAYSHLEQDGESVITDPASGQLRREQYLYTRAFYPTAVQVRLGRRPASSLPLLPEKFNSAFLARPAEYDQV